MLFLLIPIGFIGFIIAEVLGLYAGFQINTWVGLMGIVILLLPLYPGISGDAMLNIVFRIPSLWLLYIGTQYAFKVNPTFGWILLSLIITFFMSSILFLLAISQTGKK